MRQILRSKYDVVIAGLGPVGATLATLLGQSGLSVLAVDKADDLYPLPRAAAFDHEIMRIFQRIGIAEAVQPFTKFSPKYAFVDSQMNTLLEFDRTKVDWTSGWPPGVTFHQPSVERAIRNAMSECSSVDVALGVAFESYVEDGQNVHVSLRDGDALVDVSASYLIGCDGGSSPVRKFANIPLDSMDFEEPWVVVDFLSDDLTGLPNRNLQICDPNRPATYMEMGPGRYRWEFMILPHDDVAQVQTDEAIYAMLRECNVTREDKIERSAVYRFHGLVAEDWKKGRVILAGDAAHQTPPFAGQGMCSGLRDAMNLAWKLEAVLTVKAPDTLLDSYQIEREPLVRFIINSAIEMGKVVCATDPQVVAERNRRMREEHQIGDQKISMTYPPIAEGLLRSETAAAGTLFIQPWAYVDGKTAKLDDILGARACILTREPEPARTGDIAVLSINSEMIAPFKDALTGWLDAHGTDAVFIRPDMYVFGTGPSTTLAQSFLETMQPVDASLKSETQNA